MKTAVLFCFIILMPCLLFSQRKTDGRSKSVVKLGFSTLRTVNNFITDSNRKSSPTFIHYPFSEESYSITGPKLTVSITNMDSMEYFTGGLNGVLIDSLQTDKELFSLSNTQVRTYRNTNKGISWKDVTSFPFLYLHKSEAVLKSNKPNYILFDDTIAINEIVVIELKNKTKPDAIFRMRFVRIPLPLTPFRAMELHDSSSTTSETEFIKRAIEDGNKEFPSINSFYKDWPARFGQGDNNQGKPLFPTTRLAFYFRKPTANYPDSSLQYALIDNYDGDTVWHSIGHLILITKLKSDHHYALLVRYKEAPENLWQSHFFVAPKWYQTTTVRYSSIVFISLLCASVIFFIVNRKKIRSEREKSEKRQLEHKAILSQLNPHFVFNSLSSIQSLMNQGRIDEANLYFTEFSLLLRESLHKNNEEMLPLQTELGITERYIKLEQLRFHFRYEFIVEKNINTSTLEVPSLLLQPLVENAVKHGVSALENKGLIWIDITSSEKDMMVRISDNGNGFSSKENQGYGLRLTKQRILLFNQHHKDQKIELKIDSSAKGTIVTLQFLNWLS